MIRRRTHLHLCALVGLALLTACEETEEPTVDASTSPVMPGGVGTGGTPGGTIGATGGPGGAGTGGVVGGPGSSSAGTGGVATGTSGGPGGTTGGRGATTGATGGATSGGTGGSAGGPGGTGMPPGPDDGDPNAPIVSTPDVACGGPPRLGTMGSGNFMLDGRPVIVTYPCNKHAGAPMIFFLNLHGTTPVAQHFYQHRYFAAHTLAASHNLIVVTPSSVVEQWGNGDGGADAPHLMNLTNWVYSTFHGPGKFDIRAMWVGGHSWGAMYTTTYVCKPELADKIKGAVIMSSTGRNPACASKISVISTAAEDDIGPVVNQGTTPMAHGCDAPAMNMIGNNQETQWPNCDPGFVHANYFMLGKTHTSSIDAVVVERIVTLMKQARP